MAGGRQIRSLRRLTDGRLTEDAERLFQKLLLIFLDSVHGRTSGSSLPPAVHYRITKRRGGRDQFRLLSGWSVAKPPRSASVLGGKTCFLGKGQTSGVANDKVEFDIARACSCWTSLNPQIAPPVR